MAKFEVMFSVYSYIGPGHSKIDPNLMNRKQVVEANGPQTARKLVEAQYGPNCRTFGAQPVR